MVQGQSGKTPTALIIVVVAMCIVAIALCLFG